MASEVGALVAGRYRLVGVVGAGGMGSVWRAHDEVLDREVAAKEVLEQAGLTSAEQEMARRRVFREARASARLSHPGVVTVFDVVEDHGCPWIIMELIDARSLQEILDSDGPMPAAWVADIGRQVLAALAHAHGKGILHRDVKPSNVLVSPGGRAVLTDFGIAHRQGDTRLTRTGAAIGSPAFMAPEQIQGGPVTGAADLWSLGVTLYAAVEGISPFQRTDPMASLAAVLTSGLPQPQRAGPLTPALAGLLQRDPARRLTASAAAQALTAIAAGQGAETLQLPAEEQTANRTSPIAYSQPVRFSSRPRPSRSAVFTTITVATAVAAVTAVIVVVTSSRPGRYNGPTSGDAAGPSAGMTGAASTGQLRRTAPVGVTPGFHRYQDQSGFSIPVPDGWSGPERQGSSMFFYAPGRTSLIQIDQTATPGASAIGDWQNQETTLSQSRPGYQRVKIAPTGDAPPVPDATGDRAADWEYTYDGSTGRRHVLDRGFVINGHGYAILIAAPDTQWPNTLAHLSPVFAGFTAAS